MTPGEIGTTLFHRRFATLSLGQDIQVSPFDPLKEANPYLGSLTVQVALVNQDFVSKENSPEPGLF